MRFWKCKSTSILAEDATRVRTRILPELTLMANISAESLIRSPDVCTPSQEISKPSWGQISESIVKKSSDGAGLRLGNSSVIGITP